MDRDEWMAAIHTPILDREVGWRARQARRAYTIYRNKEGELEAAQRNSERPEVIGQLERERRRLALRAIKARSSLNHFVRGLNEMLIWAK
jgi:hypothetical protein